MADKHKLFFKYQRIDGVKGHTNENLIGTKLFFNYASKLNDPFDSKFNFIMEGTKEQWIDHLKQYDIDTSGTEQILNSNLVSRKNNIYVMEPSNPGYLQAYKGYHGLDFTEQHEGRICCFSENCSDILMWSHYADHHCGICLRFKFKKKGEDYFLNLDSEDFQLYRINYDYDLPPVHNILDDNPEWLTPFLLRKYKKWEYEKEYRLILAPEDFKGEPTKKYLKDGLEGIVFGLKTPPDSIKMIYNTINLHYLKHGIKVNFYRAQEVQGKYAINIEKIDNMIEYLNSLK